MQFIYDYLSAVLIAGIVFLLMTQLQMSGQTARIEATRYYANRKQMINLVEMVQQDFANIGAGIPATDDMITGYTPWAKDPSGVWKDDLLIQFKGTVEAPDPSRPPPSPLEIQYKFKRGKVVTIQENGVSRTLQTFRLERSTRDLSPTSLLTPDGGTGEILVDFEIKLLNAAGSPIPSPASNPDAARIIEVRLVTISPLGADNVIRRSRWQSQFHPINLTLKDTP